MAASKRIRLVFKDHDILSETQKLDGLNRSWVLLKPHQHDTISDVASHLLQAFQLHQSCPHGLLLSISGFVLPPFESACILKENEIISVKKRRDILSIEGSNDAAANEVQKLEAMEKQPLNSGVLLLANEEFAEEKGGFESDDPEVESEEENEEELLEDVENHSGGNADPKYRKRKATEKLKGSKRKKQRAESSGRVGNNDYTEKIEQGDHTSDHKEEKDDSKAEDSLENNKESAKSNDKNHISLPEMKRNDCVQENGKETVDAKVAPENTKKIPSRSARRKYAKRRWLREMKKIQKQNMNCESEGLRNWKEDQAKAERNKQKWKKPHADAGTEDGQPKGLLHWKQSPQTNHFVKGKRRDRRNQNDYFNKNPNQNSDLQKQENQKSNGHQRPTQDSEALELPSQKDSDVHEQASKKNGGVEEHPKLNLGASEQPNEESDEENEVVPIEIRPGHIRFEPLGKEQAVQKSHVPLETFHWNGITSKKKGQRWGKENSSFTPQVDVKVSNNVHSEMLSNEKEKQLDGVDFDKLPPLPTIPKEGDLIAYRILELSSSWTPELSAFRVGKVSWYDAESNQTTLMPVPEYPIVSKKVGEDEAVQQDSSLYKEDGSLEIDFSSLIDVRILDNGRSGPGNESHSGVSEYFVSNENASETALPGCNNEQTIIPSPDTGGMDIWDQVSEALNAKKEQLCKENGWGRTPQKVQQLRENRWGENAKNLQPSSESNWGKNTQKVQPAQHNGSGKQSSGSKSWSYKSLRGSALGPTMAILRSKKDI